MCVSYIRVRPSSIDHTSLLHIMMDDLAVSLLLSVVACMHMSLHVSLAHHIIYITPLGLLGCLFVRVCVCVYVCEFVTPFVHVVVRSY